MTRLPSLLGSLLCFASAAGALAATWENSVPPFLPGPFPELRGARAHYKFGWNGVAAASADLRFSKTGDGHYQLDAVGRTDGLARQLWKFDVQHVGTCDASSLHPLQVKEVESARGKRFETEVNFTPEGVTSRRIEERKGKVKTKTRQFAFPNILNLNAALLYGRSQKLTDGDTVRFVVYPATTAYLCEVTVLDREPLNVPAGSYRAIKLEVKLSKVDKNRELVPHTKFKSATVWLSDDADRLVLRIESQIFIGTVFAELQEVQFDSAKK